jgi:hypothetical protein
MSMAAVIGNALIMKPSECNPGAAMIILELCPLAGSFILLIHLFLQLWSLTLADNISSNTVTPPPREIIDKMKEALIMRDPQWHRFNGD